MIYRYGELENLSAIIQALPVQKRKAGNQKSKNGLWKYKDIVCAFDIETSLVKTGVHNAGTIRKPKLIDDYIAVMYIWQFQIGEDLTVYGRTWDEFRALMEELVNSLHRDERICVFVHNLSYEWQFLRDVKILGDVLNEKSVFLLKPRTPVKFLCFPDDRIEFRCSYLQTNMSLAEFTDKMQVEHGKLSGDEFDYGKTRYPWTVLTDRELEYCFNDVIGLVEALEKEMVLDGDNLYTLPITSTGYVRRDMKKAIRKLPANYIIKQLPDYPTYRMLRDAFRGGNTHASRFYSNRAIYNKISCYDLSSSYPNALMNYKYPVTQFNEITHDCLNLDHINWLISKGKAVIMKLALFNVRLRDEFTPVPYLSKDKCTDIYTDAVYDNGRILSTSYLVTTVTDIDLQILVNMYDFEPVIQNARFATYGYLPDVIRDVVRKYFIGKTELKGVEDKEIYYNKLKALLNACYGMMAQNPVKLSEIYRKGEFLTGIELDRNTGEFLTLDYANEHDIDIYEIAHSKHIDKSTMPYQWGVWCTAIARMILQRAIDLCGHQFLYCDTDSVYFYGDVDFTDFNAEAIKRSISTGAYANDVKGVTHYMGVLECDKTMTAFKTMGAKKYAYIDIKGLHITIAGVNKRKGAVELDEYAEAHHLKDGLAAMTEDFVFTDAGGTESIYNDEPIQSYNIDGVDMYIPTNVAIKPSTYKLSLSPDYKTLLISYLDNKLFGLYRLNREGAQLPSLEI